MGATVVGRPKPVNGARPVSAGPGPGAPLERIAFDWNRIAIRIKRADPLVLDSVDQIHAPAGLPQVIPTDRDLV